MSVTVFLSDVVVGLGDARQLQLPWGPEVFGGAGGTLQTRVVWSDKDLRRGSDLESGHHEPRKGLIGCRWSQLHVISFKPKQGCDVSTGLGSSAWRGE